MTNARDKANIPVLNFQSKGITVSDTNTAFVYVEENTGDAGDTAGILFKTSSADGFFKSGMILEDDGTHYAKGKLHIVQNSESNNNNATVSDAKITILNDGKVGIGDTAPQDFLEINGSGRGLGGLTISNSTHHDAALSFARSDGATARIYTVEPGSTHTSKLNFQTSDASGSAPNLLTAMVIDHNQNVGIGTTSPTAKLQVTTASSGVSVNALADELFIEGSTNSGMTIGSGSSNVGQIFFGDSEDNDIGKLSYTHNENAMMFTVNAAERMRINSNGNISIGTTNSTQAKVYIDHTGDVDDNGLYVYSNIGQTVPLLRVLQDGAGSNQPAVHVRNDGSAGGILIEKGTSGATANTGHNQVIADGSANSGFSILSGNTSNGAICFGDDGNNCKGYVNYAHNGDHLDFGVNGAEKMRVSSDGDVGIGLTSPAHRLSVFDGSTGIVARFATTGNRSLDISSADNGAYAGAHWNRDVNSAGGIHTWSIEGNEKMRITSAGYVGIGNSVTNPGNAYLTVKPTSTSGRNIAIYTNGSVGNNAGLFFNATEGAGNLAEIKGEYVGTNSGHLKFSTSMNERMRIDSSGNLLVGTTSSDPAFGATTGFEAQSSGQTHVSASGTGLIVNKTASSGTAIQIRQAGATRGQIGIKDNNSIFLANDNCGMRFFNGGNNITPSDDAGAGRDNALNLGNGSLRWNDIYATNTSIQTSDENEKQSIQSLTANEMKVAKRLSSLIKTFKWNSAVEEKGDSARIHTGLIAQQAKQAFDDESLDVSKYAFWCLDTWWEKEISVDATEEKDAHTYIDIKDEATESYTEKTRLGLRYSELFSFIQAYNDQRFTELEARITTLEANNP